MSGKKVIWKHLLKFHHYTRDWPGNMKIDFSKLSIAELNDFKGSYEYTILISGCKSLARIYYGLYFASWSEMRLLSI